MVNEYVDYIGTSRYALVQQETSQDAVLKRQRRLQ